jgi:hypothetical protein
MAEHPLSNSLEASLRRRVADVASMGTGYALVGGLAVSVRAEPRLTRDVDFAISIADDSAAEAFVHRLAGIGYTPEGVVENEATGRLATVRLSRADDPGSVTDLLFASCGIEPEIVSSAEELEALPDLLLPVAGTGHLIAMKLLARDDRRRPADVEDLRSLSAVADERAWAEALDAVRLISARGYSRERDLESALNELARGTRHGPRE